MIVGKYTDIFRGIFSGGGVRGRGLRGKLFSWRNFHGGTEFSIKRVPDFQALFQKGSEIKLNKQVFSTESLFKLNGLCDSWVILKEVEQNLDFSAKSEVLTREQTPHIHNNFSSF